MLRANIYGHLAFTNVWILLGPFGGGRKDLCWGANTIAILEDHCTLVAVNGSMDENGSLVATKSAPQWSTMQW